MQVVPILRAGLVMVEQISTVLPAQVTYHVGLVRNEETLQVRQHSSRLFLLALFELFCILALLNGHLHFEKSCFPVLSKSTLCRQD